MNIYGVLEYLSFVKISYDSLLPQNEDVKIVFYHFLFWRDILMGEVVLIEGQSAQYILLMP